MFDVVILPIRHPGRLRHEFRIEPGNLGGCGNHGRRRALWLILMCGRQGWDIGGLGGRAARRAMTDHLRLGGSLALPEGPQGDDERRRLDENGTRPGGDRPFVSALEIPGIIDLLLAENEPAVGQHSEPVGQRLAVHRLGHDSGHIQSAFGFV